MSGSKLLATAYLNDGAAVDPRAAANLGRAETAKATQTPAQAAAPVSSPGAAVTPRAAAPGEPEAVA